MSDERQARIDQIKARVDAATPGPWIQGMWSGVCERPDHATPHPGPPECTYTQYLRTYPEAMAYVSVDPDVTLIGGNDYGPWLAPTDAALIANAPADLAWLLSELDAATARAERAERAYLDIVAGDAKRFHFEDCARNPDNPPNHSRDECVGGAVDMARAALAEGA